MTLTGGYTSHIIKCVYTLCLHLLVIFMEFISFYLCMQSGVVCNVTIVCDVLTCVQLPIYMLPCYIRVLKLLFVFHFEVNW